MSSRCYCEGTPIKRGRRVLCPSRSCDSRNLYWFLCTQAEVTGALLLCFYTAVLSCVRSRFCALLRAGANPRLSRYLCSSELTWMLLQNIRTQRVPRKSMYAQNGTDKGLLILLV